MAVIYRAHGILHLTQDFEMDGPVVSVRPKLHLMYLLTVYGRP